MHDSVCLADYMKESLPFVCDSSSKNSDSYLCSRFSLLHLVSHFFFRRWSPPPSLHKVVDTASSNLDKVLSMNFSPVKFFSRLSRTSQGPVTYSSRTGRPSEFCYCFSFSDEHDQILNVHIRMLIVWWTSFVG